MRLRRLLCVLLCLPLGLLIVFSGASIKASASYSDGRYMTASEALQVFGNEISGTYYSSVTHDYESVTLSYVNVWSNAYGVHSSGNSWTYEGQEFLLYTASGLAVSADPQYISLDIRPTYSIFDTEQIHTVIAMHSGGESAGISTTYQSPSWDWYFNGSPIHLENSDESENVGTHSFIRSDGRAFQYVCADFSSVTRTSGYSYRATFFGHSGSYCYLLIGLPYVSIDSSGATGTFTTASGGSGGSGGDINVTVDVDMSETNEKIDETNGLIGSILSWIGDFFVNLGNTVRGWFVPSQDFITNWVHRLIEIIEDKFAPWPVVDQTIKDIVQRLLTALGEGGVQSVDFPTITIPGVPGGPFIEGRSVPLKGDNGAWADLIEVFASFVDVVCTIWVINMVCHRVKAVLVGEAVVEVEESD